MMLRSIRKNRLFWDCAVMAILLFLRSVNNIFIYPAILFGTAVIFLCKKTRGFNFLLFLLSFASIYKIMPGQISFLSVLFAIYIIRIISEMKVSRNFLWLLLLFIIYTVVLSGISKIVIIATTVCGFLMINYLCKADCSEYHAAIRAFSMGIILASIIGMFSKSFPILKSFIRHNVLKLGEGNYITRFAGLDGNSNYYTMNISVALSCLAVMIIREKRNGLNVALFIVLSVFGLLSVSKSFLAAWIILLVVMLAKTMKAGEKKFLIFTAILVIGGLIVYWFAFDAVKAYISRLSKLQSQTFSRFTTSRSDIWKMYMKYIFTHPKTLFLGNGIGRSLLNGRGAHNTYIESLYSLGIIGTVLYILLLKNSVRLPKIAKPERLMLLPFFILLVRMLAIGILTYDNMSFYIGLICMMVNFYCKGEENMECASG